MVILCGLNKVGIINLIKIVKICIFRQFFTVIRLDMYSYGYLMDRLVYFWVDLVGTCVDLDDMILYLYGREITNN